MQEDNFGEYRKNLIGRPDEIIPWIYADWCASGKLYRPIEKKILNVYAPLYSNLHSSENYAVNFIEKEFYKKREIIKHHFGGNDEYALVLNGQGMTTAINQCIEMLNCSIDKEETVVIITPYEHNSNFISWKSHGYNIEILQLDEDGIRESDL